ncbi:MAG: serine hydrolase domain-containing protein [Kiritimatiellia bacterium]
MTKYDFSIARKRIQQEMTKAGTPSFALAVAQNGKMLWEEAFGWADREKRIPATPHTMYSLASTSKPFTTTCLMKLVEQGKIDLDKPVNDYLASDAKIKVWIGRDKDVTVRRVANHTAGLPFHCHFYSHDEIAKKPPMEESIRRYGNVVTLPGERYRYSNIGFGILDHIVERVSGMSFADFLRREICIPLGLTRTSVDIGPGLDDFAAARYDGEGLPIPFYDVDHRGASSVYSSAHDLALFGMFFLKQPQPDQKAPLAEKTVDAMLTPTADRNSLKPPSRRWPPASGYGIGWVIDDSELGVLISHAGGMGGAVAQLALAPREGIVMAAAANGTCAIPHEIERYILPVLVPGYAQKLAKLEKKKSKATAMSLPAFKAPPELLGNWSGIVHTYERDLPFALSFKPSGEIHAKLGEQLTTLVNEVKLTDGWLTGRFLGKIFTSDVMRRPHHPYHHLGLDLKVRGDVINGAVIATAANGLSHWADLRKNK